MTQSEWVQLLKSEVNSALSILLASLAVIGGFVVALMAFSGQEDMSGTIYGGCSLALVCVLILSYSYRHQTKDRNNLIDRILKDDIQLPEDIRTEYFSIRDKDNKLSPEFAKVVLITMGIYILGIIILITAVILWLDDNDTETQTVQYQITHMGQDYFTDSVEIRDGAVVINGWHDISDRYISDTLVILDDVVTINRKTIESP